MHLTAYYEAMWWAISGVAGPLLADLRDFAQQGGALVVTAVWQGAIVVCSLAICLRLAPRTSAAQRFVVWASAFMVLVSLPLFSLVQGFTSGAAPSTSVASQVVLTRPWLQVDSGWSLLIVLLWAAVSLFRFVDLAIHSLRLRKLWKESVPVELHCGLGPLASRMWGRGPVRICTTLALQRPSVIGFFCPRILIPDWLLTRLTAGELEQIILHESEHLRRCDDWTNLFQKLCLVLFPLNPALLWIERRLCREREMACDDGVIQITHAPRAYAACLANLAERGLERRAEALSLGAWQGRSELVHRVHSVLRRKNALNPLATNALLGLLSCGLLLGSIALARCPQIVAFVPSQSTAGVKSNIRPLSAASMPAQNAVIERTATALNAGVSSARPAGRPAKRSTDEMASTRAVPEKDGAIGWETSFSASNSNSPRPVKLEAAGPGLEPTLAQQWIVFTAWEQVQTANRDKDLRADYDFAPNVNANRPAIEEDGLTGGSVRKQITVTRLIFRVIPASSVSTLPVLAPMRSGWLVIQL